MEKIICIGFGSSGRRYLKNIIKFDNYEIYIARRDLDSDIKPILADYEKYKFINYEDISKFSPYDFAFITSPSAFHFSNLKILDNLTKGSILIEKPLITDLNNLDKLLDIFKESQNRFFIGYQYRFHKLTKFIKNMIDKKNYGLFIEGEFIHSEDVRLWHPWEDYKESYSVNSNLGGGVKNTLSHDIDTALYLFGEPTNNISFEGKASFDSELISDTNDWHKSIFLYGSSDSYKPLIINSSYNSRVNLHNFILNFQKATFIGDYNSGLLEIYAEGGNLIKKEKLYSSKDECYTAVLKEMILSSTLEEKNHLTNLLDEDYINLICKVLLK